MQRRIVVSVVAVLGMLVASGGIVAFAPGAAAARGAPAAAFSTDANTCCPGGGGGGYTITFTETGLPAGTVWWVYFFGENQSTNTTSTSFLDVVNGTWNYSVAPIAGYTARPMAAEVTISGANRTVELTYEPVQYEVSLSESGLPSGTAWWASLDGGALVESTASTLMIPASNGVHSYQVFPPADYPAAVYAVHPSSGTVTVSGGPASVTPTVKFTSLIWTAKFSESGLPKGTEWSVTLNNTSWKGELNNEEFSTKANLTFSGLYNGTYSYSVTNISGYASSPETGSFVIGGADQTVKVKFESDPGALARAGAELLGEFSAVRPSLPARPCCGGPNQSDYEVNFTAVGLPSGTSWYVNLSGWNMSANTSTISFFEYNGTYNFSDAAVAGYVAVPMAGELDVQGVARNVTIAYDPVLFEVEFKESGLASGAPWWVALNGGTLDESTGTTLMIPAANGAFSYEGYAPRDYPTIFDYASSKTGSGTVAGAPLTVATAIKFASLIFSLTFTETGLPKDTEWGVTANNTSWGATVFSAGTSLEFSALFNGTYSYVVHPPSGYTASPTTGQLVISGASQKVAVTFE